MAAKSPVLHCTWEFGSNFSSGLPIKGLNFQLKSRRIKAGNGVCLVVSATGKNSEQSNESGVVNGSRFYLNFTGFPFPLGPFLNRQTIRTEVKLYSFSLFPLVSF